MVIYCRYDKVMVKQRNGKVCTEILTVLLLVLFRLEGGGGFFTRHTTLR